MNTYGCWNTQRDSCYWASSGTFVVDNHTRLVQIPVIIPDNSTKACQYRKTTPDPRCEGCTK